MSLRLASRFAARELRGGLRGFRIFLACLALGVAAIAAVGSIRAGITEGLTREGSAILGGDAQMEFTYRFASELERAWMAENANQVSEVTDFRSMAVVDNNGVTERGLTQVKSVDELYPLVGAVQLSPEMPLATAFDGAEGLPGAVMDRVLMDRLGLTPGATFRLGTQDFVLMAELTREPDGPQTALAWDPEPCCAPQTCKIQGCSRRDHCIQPNTAWTCRMRPI